MMNASQKTTEQLKNVIGLCRYVLILICLSTVKIQGETAQGICPYPIPPAHAMLSAQSYLDEFNFNGFQAYQRVHFICRVGYKRTQGSMWSICGVSGRWYPDTTKAGVCTREIRTRPVECMRRFKCRKDFQCIDRKLRCDCKPDCRDGTDEIGCKNPKQFIFATSTSRTQSGVLTSPNFPFGYPKNDFRCTFRFYTDTTKRVKVRFEEFSLRGKHDGKCDDFVKLSGVNEIYLKNKGIKGIKAMKRCGKESFDTVVSNSSNLEVQVKLNGIEKEHGKELKGYSLTWKVISEKQADVYVRKIKMKMKEEEKFGKVGADNDDNGRHGKVRENMLNILIPILISAVVPLSVISFVCFHLKSRQRQQTNGGKGDALDILKGDDDDDDDRSSPLGRMNQYRTKGNGNERNDYKDNGDKQSDYSDYIGDNGDYCSKDYYRNDINYANYGDYRDGVIKSMFNQESIGESGDYCVERDYGDNVDYGDYCDSMIKTHDDSRFSIIKTSDTRDSIVKTLSQQTSLSSSKSDKTMLQMKIFDENIPWNLQGDEKNRNIDALKVSYDIERKYCTADVCTLCMDYRNQDGSSSRKTRESKNYSSDSGTFTGNENSNTCYDSRKEDKRAILDYNGCGIYGQDSASWSNSRRAVQGISDCNDGDSDFIRQGNTRNTNNLMRKTNDITRNTNDVTRKTNDMTRKTNVPRRVVEGSGDYDGCGRHIITRTVKDRLSNQKSRDYSDCDCDSVRKNITQKTKNHRAIQRINDYDDDSDFGSHGLGRKARKNRAIKRVSDGFCDKSDHSGNGGNLRNTISQRVTNYRAINAPRDYDDNNGDCLENSIPLRVINYRAINPNHDRNDYDSDFSDVCECKDCLQQNKNQIRSNQQITEHNWGLSSFIHYSEKNIQEGHKNFHSEKPSHLPCGLESFDASLTYNDYINDHLSSQPNHFNTLSYCNT